MTVSEMTTVAPATVSYESLLAFLHREARLLDDKQWDEWLKLYAPDVEFWMPAWDDDGTLVTDPQREISLIYYGNRGGLEDRVFRIKTERSSATSLPEPRTSHNISNVEVLEQQDGVCTLRFNWFTLNYRYKITDTYFGTSFYTLDTSGERPLSMITMCSVRSPRSGTPEWLRSPRTRFMSCSRRRRNAAFGCANTVEPFGISFAITACSRFSIGSTWSSSTEYGTWAVWIRITSTRFGARKSRPWPPIGELNAASAGIR